MAFYANISIKGTHTGSASGALHGISHGNTTITPRNFASALSMVKAQYDAASGQLTGKRQHSPLLVIKKTDSSSPPLFQLASANSVLPSITITILWATGLTGGKSVGRPASGGGETVAARVSLTNATISSIRRYTPSLVPHKSSPHDTNELEEIEFAFQKITFTNLMGSTSASDDWTSNTK